MRKVLSLSDTSDRFDASSSITPIAAEALPYPRSWSRCAEYKLLISFFSHGFSCRRCRRRSCCCNKSWPCTTSRRHLPFLSFWQPSRKLWSLSHVCGSTVPVVRDSRTFHPAWLEISIKLAIS